jgi:beta-phosphoglucomutase-like phosphatase (HAD superfamily)
MVVALSIPQSRERLSREDWFRILLGVFGKSRAKGNYMITRELLAPRSVQVGTLTAAIFDVDGVLLASPHERAWREALRGFADSERFTTAMYQAEVAGKPRLRGARAALEALGVPDAAGQAAAYAECKQKRLEELIAEGHVKAFPDALRFVQAVADLGWPMAVASSSKNANGMMQSICLGSGQSLLNVFRANVCGRDLPRGKPDPAIFLLAASELHVDPLHCFVAEDAPAGIEAACAGRMEGLGVARKDDAAGLRTAGAKIVVTSLDEIAVDELAEGCLRRQLA